MRIALDAMGGDDAPRAMVQGAVDHVRAHPGRTVVLVGRKAELERELAAAGASGQDSLEIVDAPDVIGMADKMAALKELPGNSISRACSLVKEGRADGVVLCGNTGCSVAAAQLIFRRIPGVKRAGLLTPMPTINGRVWVCDVGANSENKPEQLVDFAKLGALVLDANGVAKPRIAVLSNGEEEGKGTDLTRDALELIRAAGMADAAYIEGHKIYRGEADLVVTDGFTGNIFLKTSEGVQEAIVGILKAEIAASLRNKVGYKIMEPAFQELRRRTHWSLVGGAMLVGVDGVCIKGHGRSNRVAVDNAIGQAAACIASGYLAKARAAFAGAAAGTASHQP